MTVVLARRWTGPRTEPAPEPVSWQGTSSRTPSTVVTRTCSSWSD